MLTQITALGNPFEQIFSIYFALGLSNPHSPYIIQDTTNFCSFPLASILHEIVALTNLFISVGQLGPPHSTLEAI